MHTKHKRDFTAMMKIMFNHMPDNPLTRETLFFASGCTIDEDVL